ncbi:MAG TPA: hybrid sensor histidine kinase/response regulator [Candidatus Sulfotelmatobacter sp.]|nr:hybrid sensor histidine kinase/response regulator [Candidatus Sulfotelmatobacter sp.]
MLELFRLEAENQTILLNGGLLKLEQGSTEPELFQTLMRAAHSLKGAARIVNLQAAVQIAHALEDCFVAVQNRRLRLRQAEFDLLFRSLDLLTQLARRDESELADWEASHRQEIADCLNLFAHLIATGPSASQPAGLPAATAESALATASPGTAPPMAAGPARRRRGVGSPSPGRPQPNARAAGAAHAESARHSSSAQSPSLAAPDFGSGADVPLQSLALSHLEFPERVLRLTAESLNRLLGLAGESLIESRWLRPFTDSLQRLKRQHSQLTQQMERLRHSLEADTLSERSKSYFHDLFHQVIDCQQVLGQRLQELDLFDRRFAQLSQRLYLEVLRTRMRPFKEGVRRFPRMVRDLARSLGKEVHLEIDGENTQVDRDILERLETPLAHLLRNAVDHGCEPAPERLRLGKAPAATLRLEARHSAGMLLVTVADDGAGVDLERVRNTILQRGLVSPAVARKLSESELLEFLLLPGFTLKTVVTEISGRGVGLDIVHHMVRSVRGAIRLNNQSGQGLRVQLQLPLTLSVLRALLVEIAGEPYAIPLSQITRTLKVPRPQVQVLEGRYHFHFNDQQVGLLTAHQVLECGEPQPLGSELPVVVLGERNTRYGLIVDRFLGERELVVQPLDPRLGKIQDISAAALMDDGTPALIIDVEDMTRSIEKLVRERPLKPAQGRGLALTTGRTKHILTVDDSPAVRELVRKLLTSRGYQAEVAADGLDGLNALRTRQFDLLITDVEMPRLDGIELTGIIRQDPQLKGLPVLMVSCKDRAEDQKRGLEAGADYYLGKSTFQDETLLQAVVDLIGEATT